MASIVFFERHGTFRNWTYSLVTAGSFAVGFTALGVVTWNLLEHGVHADNLFGVVFSSIWTLGVLSPGLWIGWRIAFRPDWYSRIDDQGIASDGRFWPWSKISRVFTLSRRGFSDKVWICFHTRGWLVCDWPVYGAPALPSETAGEILASLEEFLDERYSEVTVG